MEFEKKNQTQFKQKKIYSSKDRKEEDTVWRRNVRSENRVNTKNQPVLILRNHITWRKKSKITRSRIKEKVWSNRI